MHPPCVTPIVAAATRLQRQAAPQRRALAERTKPFQRTQTDTRSRTTRTGPPDPYHQWLDTPKNLSARALAEAQGSVRVRNPERTISQWVERSQADRLFDQGWTLD